MKDAIDQLQSQASWTRSELLAIVTGQERLLEERRTRGMEVGEQSLRNLASLKQELDRIGDVDAIAHA